MTTEPYDSVPTIGYGTLIQARVCRPKRESKGEACAKEISDVSNFDFFFFWYQLIDWFLNCRVFHFLNMNCIDNCLPN